MRRLVISMAGAAVAFVVLPAGAAGSDGVALPGIQGGAGVVSPVTHARFVTLFAGQRSTIVARLQVAGGQVERSRLIHGSWSVPQVGLDGTGGGLSGDGRILVLAQPRNRFPMPQTRLVVLDTVRFSTLRRITLRGDFGYDALSPDGSTMYLINYLSRRDPTKYSVRAYDVVRSQLLPEPVIDPHEKGDEMRGYPITRVSGPGGRWAYTLYDGGGTHPFVHALDTTGRTAVCIDLDQLAGRNDLFGLRLRLGDAGRRLTVMDHSDPLVVVDTKSFKVSQARAAAPAAARKAPADGGGGGSDFPWLLVGLLVVGATAVAVAGAGLRRTAGGARAR